mgnify:CR=1 FL=1
MKKKLVFIVITLSLIVVVEVFMRLYFGFCDTVLMQSSPDYEYIAQPNQKRFRFRNHISYNNNSMRSKEVNQKAVKILGFGDSVINGGVQTDNDSLATTILSDALTVNYQKEIQFLNISAGSWGPDNCYAYMEENGDFDAKAIFLFFSSHDAYDNMNFEPIIDLQKSFPSKQYISAIYELFDRYLVPRLINKISNSKINDLGITKKSEESKFNTGFKSFLDYSNENNIPLVIYLHADNKEYQAGAYNEQGNEIIVFAQKNNIPIIQDLENNLELSDFRDGIHINSQGQKKLANTILKYIHQTPVHNILYK